jgi:hypothetical protein
MNSRQISAGNRQPIDYFLSDAPQAAGLSDAPQAAGLSDAPQAAGLSDAPHAAGLSDAPHAAGLSAAGLSDAPQEEPESFFFHANRFFSAMFKNLQLYITSGSNHLLNYYI